MQSPNVKPEQGSTTESPRLIHEMEESIDLPVSHNGNITAGTKRKMNSASPRGVANLTPEQLARKRANDRQAQRAIRERTKSQIEALERRVRELSSQQPYQDIHKLVSERNQIMAENQDIKRRLGAMMNILQPLVDRDGMPMKSPTTAVTDTTVSNSSNTVIMPTNTAQVPAETTHPSPLTDQSHGTPGSVESSLLDHPWTESVAGNVSPSNSVLQHWQRSDPISLLNTVPSQRLAVKGMDEKLILNFLIDNPRQIPKIGDIPKLPKDHNHSPDPPSININIAPPPTAGDYTQAHLVAIRNIQPTCPLDSIFLDFLSHRRRELTTGSQQRLAYPSVSSLLNPVENSTHSYSISKVFSDILRTFPDISSLPEQVGTLYTMFQIMRWQIYPTQKNYDRIPDWLTPRPAQLFSPHPAWMDYILWPKVRDRLAYAHRDYPFENWFVPYTRTISCNWPYEPTDCLLHNTESDELVINPVFERHIRELSNWTVGTEFAEAYPNLVDAVKIRHDDRRARPP
ncbi:hypothetical protein UA08_00847 [Talaromyces atroroseus]|uniref:BZIP domain-containing protein n=1 Tax=Talaromyces atroroseus TaxID=1441469 RepID=A0A225AQK4_TALAT|nr:hypothetical protein UA08_00847 [Talaromyces atroroseus]OKL63901.1 hypothetical protein UA08_00847 [Talaromyces atroroseus]